jgi:hypothetical protein
MAEGSKKGKLVAMPHAGLWSRPVFRHMDTEQQLTWLYIVTGEHAIGGIPGLFRLTKGQVLDRVNAEMCGDPSIDNWYIDDLVSRGWIAVDEDVGLMRIPGVASDVPTHKNALAIGRMFAKLPASPLVSAHLAELRSVINDPELFRVIVEAM